MPKRTTAPRTGRLGALQKKRLFAAAYLANGGNGQEAARAAGSRGIDASLRAIASKLLTDVNVQEMLRAKVEAVEHAMGADEVMERLTRVARMLDTIDNERPNVFDFVTFLGTDDKPLRAEAPMVASSLEDAAAQVKAAGDPDRIPGFAIDLPKAKALGRGHLVRELAHDAETGAPKIKLGGDRIAILQQAVRALEIIARCKGMMRDAPAPPPKPDLTAEEAFRLLPEALQEAYHAAYKAALDKRRAITVEAKRLGG